MEERYHRVNHERMELTVTLDDPKAYTRPWTPRNQMRLTLAPADLDMMEMIFFADRSHGLQEKHQRPHQ